MHSDGRNVVQLPYNFTPRFYQRAIWEARFKHKKRLIVHLAHRRSGKDFNAMNILISSAAERMGQYYHLFPTTALAKQVIFEGVTNDSVKMLECFPPALLQLDRPFNKTDLTVRFSNGSIYKTMGITDDSKIVGTNIFGIVMSEYATLDPMVYEYIRPIFAGNDGFIIFAYTPRGRNHGYDLYQQAWDDIQDKGDASIYAIFNQPVSLTKALPDSMLEHLRNSMPAELFLQEYFCSFRAGLSGSYYGDYVEAADREGRIGDFPYNPELPVHTAWDLGVGDATAIIFFQRTDSKVIIIDYHEDVGKGIVEYLGVLQLRGYKIYGDHYAPHDIRQRELSGGQTRLQIAAEANMNFIDLPKWNIDEGINAARRLFKDLCFNFPQRTGAVNDKNSVGRLLGALRDYHKKWNETTRAFDNRPLHNWASHPADALRYMAMAISPPDPLIDLDGESEAQSFSADFDAFGYDGENDIDSENVSAYNPHDF